MPYIDPRLNRHLRNAHEDMLIDAIFIIGENEEKALKSEQIIQKIREQTHEKPSFIRFIPRANAVAVTAHPRFINALIDHCGVQVASCTTIDPFYFP